MFFPSLNKLLTRRIIIIFIFGITLSTPARSADMAPLEISLNTLHQGTFFALIDADEKISLSVKDLLDLGLSVPDGDVIDVDGEKYRSIISISGLDYIYDPSALTLKLEATPALLGSTTIDLHKRFNQESHFPYENSLFFNYALRYQDGSNIEQAIGLDNELGVRRGNSLFLTESRYLTDAGESSFIRLNTSLIHENKHEMTRWTFGDFFTPNYDLGGAITFGGIQYQKRFRIDPYFKAYPTLDFAGAVTSPSDIEILIDGHRVLHENIPPGSFLLDNISTFRGAGNMEIIIKDTFGREQRIVRPYYLADSLLTEGLHDFSYSLGAIRDNFGTENFDYGTPSFQGLHNYGLSKDLTIGTTIEASSKISNLSLNANWQVGQWGMLHSAIYASTGDVGSGYAMLANYQYLTRFSGIDFLLAYFDEAFGTLSSLHSLDDPEFSAKLSLSFSSRDYGAVTISGKTATDYNKDNLSQANLTYSKQISNRWSVVTTYTGNYGRDESQTIYFSLSYQPKADLDISTRFESNDSADFIEIEAKNTQLVGEGYNYGASIRQSNTTTGASTLANPSLEYRSKYGVYAGEIWYESGGNESGTSYQFETTGAVTFVGGQFGLTRPVTDSFAMVKVGDLENVPVYLNSQKIGKTNSEGKIFITELNSYFNNQISIDDSNIPMDRTIKATRYLVTPPLRSGVCVYFAATRFQPITGRLIARQDDNLIPVEFREFDLWINDDKFALPSGKGGEFYFDPQELLIQQDVDLDAVSCSSLKNSTESKTTSQVYTASIDYNGNIYQFKINADPTDGFYIDVGNIVVNDN